MSRGMEITLVRKVVSMIPHNSIIGARTYSVFSASSKVAILFSVLAISLWAGKTAHVINMSLGSSSYSQALADAVQAASDAGVLVVSAAGNSGCCDTVLYPAKLPESMAIAAVDVNDQRASFSST